MSDGMKYGDVALGVEAALPALRPAFGYARFRRSLVWLCAVLKRWA